MSKKSILWTVIVVVAAVIVVWLYIANSGAGAPAVQPTGDNSGNAPAASDNGSVTSPAATSNPNDSSNSALDQDLSNVDQQLNGMSSDTQSINSGLNDQPVTQGQ